MQRKPGPCVLQGMGQGLPPPEGLLGQCSVSRAVLSESVATGHRWLLKFRLIKVDETKNSILVTLVIFEMCSVANVISCCIEQ